MLQIDLERDELARNLGGALPGNSIILIEGKDGTGKSIVSQRFCYSMLLKGKTITYVSTELNTPEFIAQMMSLDYDIKYHLLNEKIKFIPLFPFIGKTRHRGDFLDCLLNASKLYESDVIFIDTLSFLLVQDSISKEKLFDVINMLKKIVTMNRTLVFTVDPEHLEESLLTQLRAMSDVYFKTELKTFAGEPVRAISIVRFKRPQDNFMSIIPFKVEPGKGLAIEIASFS